MTAMVVRRRGKKCVVWVLKDRTEKGWWRWAEGQKDRMRDSGRGVVERRSESAGDEDDKDWQPSSSIWHLQYSTDPAAWILKHQPVQREGWRKFKSGRKRCHSERSPGLKLEICCQRKHQCIRGWHSELNLTLFPADSPRLLVFHTNTHKRVHTQLHLAVNDKAGPV